MLCEGKSDGISGAASSFLKSVDMFDVEKHKFTIAAEMTVPRCNPHELNYLVGCDARMVSERCSDRGAVVRVYE